MTGMRRDIAMWFWRLLPANPIFLRVVHGGGKRIRHLWIRSGYLAVLFLVMFFALLNQGQTGGALDDLARGSTQVFRFVSIVQLAMMCFFAPIFMAAAITQEKDSRTYSILLSTPLSNAQIVLGSLMSRLFFVLVMLLAGVPILYVTTIYGGVTFRQIQLSTGIAATTAVLTGSLAIAIGAARVGTRRTIFSFYLAIALYLLIVGALGYPSDFRLRQGALRPVERSKVIDQWVASGQPRPTDADIDRLLQTDPDKLDTAVKAVIRDKTLADDLLDKLRQADDAALEAQETVLRFPGCPHAPPNTDGRRMSLLAPFHPLLALQVALNEVEAPPVSAGLGWPMDSLLAQPYYGYMILTSIASLVAIIVSMTYVRRGGREGEATVWTWLKGLASRFAGTNHQRHRPRRVWQNPVAWREAKTRASFAGQGIMRYVLAAIGLGCGALLLGWRVLDPIRMNAEDLRFWLTGLVVIQSALILLMAANSAATALTREREANTMDLLLCTPLTSGYIIYGKLRGLVSFLFPLIMVPGICLIAFAAFDYFSGTPRAVIWPEAALELVLLLVVYTAFACMLGLQMSLQFRRTVPAVLSSVAILMGVSFALGACGYGLVEISETFGAMIAPFTPFTAVSAVVNPIWTLRTGDSVEKLTEARLLLPVGAATAAAFYLLIVLGMYRTMIRNFDMIVRKQSA